MLHDVEDESSEKSDDQDHNSRSCGVVVHEGHPGVVKEQIRREAVNLVEGERGIMYVRGVYSRVWENA